MQATIRSCRKRKRRQSKASATIWSLREQNDRGTSYQAYIAVQNEIVKAIDELRDEFARVNFNRPYASLDEEQQKIVREAIPQNISEAEPKDVSKR